MASVAMIIAAVLFSAHRQKPFFERTFGCAAMDDSSGWRGRRSGSMAFSAGTVEQLTLSHLEDPRAWWKL
jgi:hypothetical protein